MREETRPLEETNDLMLEFAARKQLGNLNDVRITELEKTITD
jgi:hypothetical protein